MRPTYLLAALLLATAAMASASRAGQWDTHSMRSYDRGKEEGCAAFATKFEVPPNQHKKFIDEWQRLYNTVVDEEKHNTAYELKKTAGDNMFFWAYGEWESMDDFMDHHETDYVKAWHDFLRKEDIEYEMFPLKKVTGDVMKESGNVDRRKRTGDEDLRDTTAHAFIQYHIPPSMVDDFVSAWEEVADRTEGERDSTSFVLRKVNSMNHHYIACGTWETFDAFMDHLSSKHVRRMHQFTADNGIEWYVDIMRDIGEHKARKTTA